MKGIFVSPLNDGQPTDYPAAKSATYLSNDGASDYKYLDLDLPFTARAQMAQRLAWIALKRHRNELAYVLECSLAAYQVQAGETIYVTNAVRGWSSKAFEVEESTLLVDQDAKGVPVYKVRLKVKATASTDFDFTPGADETLVAPSPVPVNSSLNPGNPTGFTLQSGTSFLDVRQDGTVFARIYGSWTAPTDQFVLQGGRIEVEYKKSSESDWRQHVGVDDPANIDYCWILDVLDGVAYDVRIRSVNQIGARASSWVTVSSHTVVGKTAPPSDVTGFACQQNGPVVTFKWTQISDVDLAGYELRFAAQGIEEWDQMVLISAVTRGTLVTNAAIPPGSWTVGIKAVDTSGNYSTNVTLADIDVINTFDIVESLESHPAWHSEYLSTDCGSVLDAADSDADLMPACGTLAATIDARLDLGTIA